MMGSVNQGSEEAQLYASHDEMENQVINESFGPKSFSNYRSAMSSLPETHQLLSLPTILSSADFDPLLSPSMDRDLRSSGESDKFFTEPLHFSDVNINSSDENNVHDLYGIGSPIKNEENSGGLSRSSSLNLDYLKITVLNPQKEQEISNSIVPGGNSYVTYLISTKTNIAEFGGSEFSVRRRFKDVVTLSERLAESYRGFFIPPRPDKSVVEGQMMQKQEFVEQRRVALEKYLRKLAAHPVIRKSDEFKVFLQVQGKLPLPKSTDVASRMLDGAVKLPKQLLNETTVAPQEVVQPAIGGRDLLRLFKELKQSVTNDWGSSKPPVVEEDKEFLERKEKLHDFEQQLSAASLQAEALVKAQQDIAETMGELGMAFIKLTKFENEEAVFNSQRVRATDMKNVATGAVKDVLHDYLGLMLAVHGAFSERSSALLTEQTLLSELASLHSRAEKLEAASSRIFGGDKSRIQKLEQLKEAIRTTEDAKNVANQEYERIKENNRSELERFDRERQADFLNMLKGFVTNQAGFAEKIAHVWEKVAEETSSYSKEISNC